MASASFAAVGLSPPVTATAGAAAKGAGSPLKKVVTAFKDFRDKVLETHLRMHPSHTSPSSACIPAKALVPCGRQLTGFGQVTAAGPLHG